MASTQGYMFQANYRPTKNLSIGANAGYRFSKLDPRPSKNLYSYVTYSNVPWIKCFCNYFGHDSGNNLSLR